MSITLSLSCCCDMRQEQRQMLALRQELHVRCLVVYFAGMSCYVPIRPSVTTRAAKKTGYEYCEVEMGEAENGACVAGMYTMIGELPEELKHIVRYRGCEET